MVGVRNGIGHDTPRLVPAETVLVHENAHELRDNERGVGVVYLNDMVLGKGANVAVALHVLAHDALHGRRDEEILLLEPQLLALNVVVGGIEHLGDDLAHGALLKALYILALGEQVHIERRGAACIPKAQGVDRLALVACDEHISRHGGDGGVADMLGVVVAVIIPVRNDVSAKAHLDGLVRAGHEPALGCRAPVVGDLGLLAVPYLLPEDAQLVAYRVARCGNTERRHGVHVAGGESAETAVAETCVVFLLENVACVSSEVTERPDERFGNAQIEGIFHKASAHEKLHGQIMHLTVGLPVLAEGQKAAHYLTDNDCRGTEHLIVCCVFTCDAELRTQLIFYRRAHLVTGDLTFIH